MQTLQELLSQFPALLEKSIFMSYLLSFLGGFVSSLEPCLYVMIPVTIGFIASQAGVSKLKSFLLSLIYVTGVAITYSTLGVVAAISGKVFGTSSGSPIPYLILGNIFLLMALASLDVITLRIPNLPWATKISASRKGFLQAFLLGIISAFVAGPCTAAVLFAILSYVAKTQSIITGFTLLLSFSLGMGMLLLLVGTFTGILGSLPKAGSWLNKVRKGVGFFLIILAEYFIIQGARLL